MTTAPAVLTFGDAAIDGALTVAAVGGRVRLHVELAGQPFCTLLLDRKSALAVNLRVSMLLVDQARRDGER